MRILFLNSFWYLPQTRGGLSRTVDQLGQGLKARGHHVAVLALLKNNHDRYSLWHRIKLRLARTLGHPAVSLDRYNDCLVYRCWDIESVLGDVVEREKPDLAVIAGGAIVPLARAAKALGLPVVTQVHDVEFYQLGGDLAETKGSPCVANSEFTAGKYRAEYGLECEVVLPFIRLADYRTETSRKSVLYIHPVWKKGVEKAVAIAQACPDIPFIFVGENGYHEARKELGLPEPGSLANVTFLPDLADMRDAYRKAKVLLVPSQWEEAYGRVVNEAQVSGIPALVSQRGGLTEAMADGGISLPHDAPVEQWVEALRRMWDDEALYAELSDKALASARRPELSETFQLDAHERIMQEALAGADR